MIGAVSLLWLLMIFTLPALDRTAVPAQTIPQEALGSIDGFVFEDSTSKKPVRGAKVSLYPGRDADALKPLDQKYTNAQGQYHFDGIARASDHSLYALKLPEGPSSNIVPVSKLDFAVKQHLVGINIFLREAPR